MSGKSLSRPLCLLALVFCLTLTNTQAAPAHQDNNNASSAAQSLKKDDADIEVQLHLLIGSNKEGEGAKLPSALEPALRQLRTELPLTNYRLGATFLHRVKNGRTLEVKGTGGLVRFGAPVPSPGVVSANSPTFYQFVLAPVELRTNDAGQLVISVSSFKIGMRVPIVTSYSAAGNSSAGALPVIQYEDTGINTGLSVREGEPVVVGTLYVGPEGDAVIVVVTARRITGR